MADVTIYKDPAQVNVVVVDGVPPTDQSAQIAQLMADLATRTGERDALQAKITAALADMDAADAGDSAEDAARAAARAKLTA